MLEFVDGVRHLQGDPWRSDTVSVDLMIRTILDQTDILGQGVDNALDRLGLVIQRVS